MVWTSDLFPNDPFSVPVVLQGSMQSNTVVNINIIFPAIYTSVSSCRSDWGLMPPEYSVEGSTVLGNNGQNCTSSGRLSGVWYNVWLDFSKECTGTYRPNAFVSFDM